MGAWGAEDRSGAPFDRLRVRVTQLPTVTHGDNRLNRDVVVHHDDPLHHQLQEKLAVVIVHVVEPV